MRAHPGQRQSIRLIVLVVLVLTLASIGSFTSLRTTGESVSTGPCAAGQAVPASASTPAGIASDDDMLAEVARRVPGFSGMFVEAGIPARLIVTVADTSQAEAIRAAIVAVYGRDRIPAGGIQLRPAEYRFVELKAWYDCMRDHIWQLKGLAYTDINEATNRIELGVISDEWVTPLWDKIRQLGIPTKAVTVKVTGPIRAQ